MKKSWLLRLTLILAVFACGLVAGHTIRLDGEAALAIEEPTLWPVVYVVDGDTLDILYQPPFPIEQRLRLLQADTPERREPGYQEAKEALEQLVISREVSIEFEEPGEHEEDNFGRALVYLYSGGKCINLELVRLGWAKNYTEYGEGRMNQEFEEAEQEAREAERGLWAPEWSNGG